MCGGGGADLSTSSALCIVSMCANQKCVKSFSYFDIKGKVSCIVWSTELIPFSKSI